MFTLIALQLATATLPYSHMEYCERTRDSGCRVQTITLEDLGLIHKAISEAITTVEDPSPDDPWVAFPPNRQGDCDDQAATERRALINFGMDPERLHFETGEVTEPDGRRVGHIVLVVTMPHPDGGLVDVVLDRKTPDMIYSRGKRPYEWRPMAQESDDGPAWKAGG